MISAETVCRDQFYFNKMSYVTCILAYLLAISNSHVAEANVQWYRTAQGTSDRLTKQSDLQFSGDFSFDQVVMINR